MTKAGIGCANLNSRERKYGNGTGADGVNSNVHLELLFHKKKKNLRDFKMQGNRLTI